MSRPEHFSRPWPTDPWSNTMAGRGFDAPTGCSLPWVVRALLVAVLIVLGFSLWAITSILRGPDRVFGS